MSPEDKSRNQRMLFLAIAIISLGIALTTVFEKLKPVGIVMIAIGGLLFIVSMKRKNDNEKK